MEEIEDFVIFQNEYTRLIQNNKTNILLENLRDYGEYKEVIWKIHEDMQASIKYC